MAVELWGHHPFCLWDLCSECATMTVSKSCCSLMGAELEAGLVIPSPFHVNSKCWWPWVGHGWALTSSQRGWLGALCVQLRHPASWPFLVFALSPTSLSHLLVLAEGCCVLPPGTSQEQVPPAWLCLVASWLGTRASSSSYGAGLLGSCPTRVCASAERRCKVA